MEEPQHITTTSNKTNAQQNYSSFFSWEWKSRDASQQIATRTTHNSSTVVCYENGRTATHNNTQQQEQPTNKLQYLLWEWKNRNTQEQTTTRTTHTTNYSSFSWAWKNRNTHQQTTTITTHNNTTVVFRENGRTATHNNKQEQEQLTHKNYSRCFVTMEGPQHMRANNNKNHSQKSGSSFSWEWKNRNA